MRWLELKVIVPAEMPLADGGGAVALLFEHVGHGDLLHPYLADPVLLPGFGVVEDTEAGGEPPAHEALA